MNHCWGITRLGKFLSFYLFTVHLPTVQLIFFLFPHWNRFKNTIGELKYIFKTTEFTIALTMLAGMAHLESNVDNLDVSIEREKH